MVYDGYLPYDSSGDWLYHAIELLSLALSVTLIVLAVGPFRSTYKPDEEDGFGKTSFAPQSVGAVWVALPCFVVAIVIHPTLNKNWFTDIMWTYAMYQETFAVIPQLYAFQKLAKTNKPVEQWTSHFVFALAFSRVLMLFFWLSSYHELSDNESSSVTGGWVGLFVLLNQFVHVFVMGDYVWYWLKSAKQGGPLVLPGMQV